MTGPLRQRRLRLALLVLAVGWLHLWLMDQHLPPRLGEGAADRLGRRIDVTFVRELKPTAPPALPPRPRPPSPRLSAVAALPAASAALAVVPQAEPAMEPAPQASLGDVLEALPSLPAPVVVEPDNSTPARFEWPPSTRLSYTLSGNYRGPVQGQAQVEWLRSGSRYQVLMDVSAALMFTRRSSSEGEITPEGLSPQRYEEEDRIRFFEPRRRTITMDAQSIRLPDGRVLPRPPGLQDSVSQMVQLTWLFTTQPAWLTAGQSIELPVALPRRVERIVYDVGQTEALDTPAGTVGTVHVRPRREARAGGDLTVEFWVAPSLQYLPVRVLIRQDTDSFVDLLIERLPQQAGPER